jgi:hypothetical protein
MWLLDYGLYDNLSDGPWSIRLWGRISLTIYDSADDLKIYSLGPLE